MPKWKISHDGPHGAQTDEVEATAILNRPEDQPVFVDFTKPIPGRAQGSWIVLRVRAENVRRIDLLEE